MNKRRLSLYINKILLLLLYWPHFEMSTAHARGLVGGEGGGGRWRSKSGSRGKRRTRKVEKAGAIS